MQKFLGLVFVFDLYWLQSVNGGEKARKSGGHFWCLDKSQARREASSLPSPLILDNGPERGGALR